MGLMMLAASLGCSIKISAEGADADVALAELVALVQNGFGENDAEESTQ
jgi:phosphocarrier protein